MIVAPRYHASQFQVWKIENLPNDFAFDQKEKPRAKVHVALIVFKELKSFSRFSWSFSGRHLRVQDRFHIVV